MNLAPTIHGSAAPEIASYPARGDNAADNGSADLQPRRPFSLRIEATALRFRGEMIAGRRIVEHRRMLPAALALWIDRTDFDDAEIEHGFISSTGEFLTRAEALPIAIAAGQLSAGFRPGASGLQSQDLLAAMEMEVAA